MLYKLSQMLKMPPEEHLDAPETTANRKAIIFSKSFLYNFYKDCYSFFQVASEGVPKGEKLEIGSGSGFLHKYITGILRSDVLFLPDLDLVCAAQNLPFAKNALSAVYMLNVLHHVQDVTLFFEEVRRCLKPGGALIMVEPASTFWSSFIYSNFHNERFDKKQKDWDLPAGGPLSTANGALPWIVFERDKKLFMEKFPEMIIDKIDCVSPLTYLLSGGYSYKQLLPGPCYPIVKMFETFLAPFNRVIGLFMRIKLFCAK